MLLRGQIPVVDLSLEDKVASRLVRQASTTIGFFYITNHGIPLNLIGDLFAQARAFFELPVEEKLKIKLNSDGRGYGAPFSEKLDLVSTKSDSKERFGMGAEAVESDVPLSGPNQWPDSKKLPEFRSTLNGYFEQAVKLTKKRLLRLAALSLGLDPNGLDKFVDGPTSYLGLLHYFTNRSRPDEGEFSAGAHTDFGLITLLATSGVNGLQVRYGDEWVDVPHKEGAIVVNFGDMMERVSNGIYQSALHRVINNHGLERYSVAFFLEPDARVPVEPHPDLCKGTGKTHAPVHFADYLLMKFKAMSTDPEV